MRNENTGGACSGSAQPRSQGKEGLLRDIAPLRHPRVALLAGTLHAANRRVLQAGAGHAAGGGGQHARRARFVNFQLIPRLAPGAVDHCVRFFGAGVAVRRCARLAGGARPAEACGPRPGAARVSAAVVRSGRAAGRRFQAAVQAPHHTSSSYQPLPHHLHISRSPPGCWPGTGRSWAGTAGTPHQRPASIPAGRAGSRQGVHCVCRSSGWAASRARGPRAHRQAALALALGGGAAGAVGCVTWLAGTAVWPEARLRVCRDVGSNLIACHAAHNQRSSARRTTAGCQASTLVAHIALAAGQGRRVAGLAVGRAGGARVALEHKAGQAAATLAVVRPHEAHAVGDGRALRWGGWQARARARQASLPLHSPRLSPANKHSAAAGPPRERLHGAMLTAVHAPLATFQPGTHCGRQAGQELRSERRTQQRSGASPSTSLLPPTTVRLQGLLPPRPCLPRRRRMHQSSRCT